MKLPLRLGLVLLGLLVIGGGAFVGWRHYLTPQTSERVIVKDKGDEVHRRSRYGEDARARRVDAASFRRHVRRTIERVLPHLGVLPIAELPPHVNVQTLGAVELSHAPQMV
jgi:flagellar biosynthesis component FlhA